MGFYFSHIQDPTFCQIFNWQIFSPFYTYWLCFMIEYDKDMSDEIILFLESLVLSQQLKLRQKVIFSFSLSTPWAKVYLPVFSLFFFNVLKYSLNISSVKLVQKYILRLLWVISLPLFFYFSMSVLSILNDYYVFCVPSISGYFS